MNPARPLDPAAQTPPGAEPRGTGVAADVAGVRTVPRLWGPGVRVPTEPLGSPGGEPGIGEGRMRAGLRQSRARDHGGSGPGVTCEIALPAVGLRWFAGLGAVG